MSDGDRRKGRAGRSSVQHTRSSARKRLAVAGAVGVVGFAVFYFFDPLEGPRRRRRAIEALQEAAFEALRLSQQLVNRFSEPVESLRPVEAPTRVEEPEVATTAGEDADLATTLRDEVAIFRFEPPPAEEAAVPVGVGGPAEDTPQAGDRVGDARAAERVKYIHAAPIPPPPRPTIISYDAKPDEPRVDEYTEASTTRPPRASSTRRVLVGTAAVLVLLAAAALGAWAVWGGGNDEGTTAAPALPSGATQAIELISQPGARSVSVAGSKGTMVLVVAPNGRAALIISGLDKAPPGKEYQAWIVTGKTPKSAGLFKGGSTRLVIPLAQRIPKGSIFAVTLERAGGAPAPTQAPRFTAKLA